MTERASEHENDRNRMMAGMTTDAAQMLEELFGPVLDVEAVLKSMPDQADVHVNRPVRSSSARNKFERASNAVGLTAGLMAIGAAARDPRLAAEGAPKWTKRLHATGAKIPSPISSKGGKAGALLAAGALGTQFVNSTGDVAIGGTLAAQGQREKRRKKQVVAAKRAPALHPEIKNLSRKVVEFWKPVTQPPPAAGPAPGTRAAVKEQRKTDARATQLATDQQRGQRVGRDVGRMMSTTSGKVAAGTLAATGASKATGGRRQGYEYVPDYYAKADGDITFRGEFTKFDDAKRQAFGWASVVVKDGAPVLDRQGDYISIEDLEDAAYTYVHKSRVGGDMHRRNGDAPHHVSDMIESIVFTPEKIEKMGLPAGFPQGWWVGYQIHDEATWDEVRKRGRTGFSIHGRGIRRDMDIDELMGAR